jgi:hypothetical protein
MLVRAQVVVNVGEVLRLKQLLQNGALLSFWPRLAVQLSI